MAITNRNIGRVLQVISDEVKQYTLPIITLQANHKRDPFRVLIATMLSLRTKDEVTAVASKKLFKVNDTVRGMNKLTEARIAKLIYPVGFYKTKAKSIKKVCKILLEEHDGKVPDEIDELVKLPGVGRKTANLVLIEGYQKDAMCVDTHVHRISNRWDYVRTKEPDKTELALREKLPRKYWIRYNELLVSWGQHICVPVSPKCSQCPLRKQCPRRGVTKSR